MDWNPNNQNMQGYGQGNPGQNMYGQNVYGQNVYDQGMAGQSVYGQGGDYAQGTPGQAVYQNVEMQRAMLGNDTMGGGFYDGPAQSGGVVNAVSEAMQQEVVKQSFIYMVAALVVTAVSAFTTRDLLLKLFMTSPQTIIGLFVVELVIVFASGAVLKKNNAVLAAILFTLYSFINGATIGVILYAYTASSAGAAFLMAAGMFGVMAVYGLVTNRDLTSIGSFCLMGVVGVIIATVVNGIFLLSEGLDFFVSIVCVLLFVGLTAYDTQKIKERVRYSNGENTASLALFGAFQLYLDFINIFLRLLRIMGRRK